MNAKAITWTASAAQVETLEKVARALNGVSWCEKDNTAQSVFEQFIKWGIDTLLDNPKQLADEISDSIETNEADNTDADNRKTREVYHAICRAFNVGESETDGREDGREDGQAKANEGTGAAYWQAHPDMMKRILANQVQTDNGEGMTK